MQKKILFITNTLCQGGAEHALISTLKHVSKSKYDITLFVVKPVLDLIDDIPKGIRVIVGEEPKHNRDFTNIVLCFVRKIALLFGRKDFSDGIAQINSERLHNQKRKNIVKKYIKNESFDVIICNTLSNWSTEIACMIKTKKRYLVYHGSTDTHHDMLNVLLKDFHGIVAVSPEVKTLFMQWYEVPEKDICVIENLIEADKIKMLAQKKTDLIEKKDSETIICSCGRLTHEKGFDLAIEAADILKKRGYVFKWFFVGDGAERKKLEDRIKELGIENSICITGMLNNPFAVINECDIYVQPSYEESYGRTIKEALILGKPVVSTDTVGGRLLLSQGEKGILTAINAESIANGIEIYLQDKEQMEKYSNLYRDDEYEHEKNQYEMLWEDVLDS